ncbi:MAG: YdbL family protein [Psychrosphaera sp.]|nr:YdbL family protein [Psychrosphaera sp.]NQZ10062.1 YdbL family protein [Algicola sp.]
MHTFIKRLSLIMLALTFSVSAFAMSLQDAKRQGKVGEQPSGYLGVVVSNAEVITLVKKVNNKRKQLYIKMARKNKISLKQVAALAGEKALKKTASGNYIKNAAGKWVKK